MANKEETSSDESGSESDQEVEETETKSPPKSLKRSNPFFKGGKSFNYCVIINQKIE